MELNIDIKNQVLKIINKAITDYDTKWKSNVEKERGTREYSIQIVKIFEEIQDATIESEKAHDNYEKKISNLNEQIEELKNIINVNHNNQLDNDKNYIGSVMHSVNKKFLDK
jgi:hypothetical protein